MVNSSNPLKESIPEKERWRQWGSARIALLMAMIHMIDEDQDLLPEGVMEKMSELRNPKEHPQLVDYAEEVYYSIPHEKISTFLHGNIKREIESIRDSFDKDLYLDAVVRQKLYESEFNND